MRYWGYNFERSNFILVTRRTQWTRKMSRFRKIYYFEEDQNFRTTLKLYFSCRTSEASKNPVLFISLPGDQEENIHHAIFLKERSVFALKDSFNQDWEFPSGGMHRNMDFSIALVSSWEFIFQLYWWTHIKSFLLYLNCSILCWQLISSVNISVISNPLDIILQHELATRMNLDPMKIDKVINKRKTNFQSGIKFLSFRNWTFERILKLWEYELVRDENMLNNAILLSTSTCPKTI